jgi:aldehyde:ferredoxin oxidoreductase
MSCIGCPIADKDYLKVECEGPNQFNKITTSASNISTLMLFGIKDLMEATQLLGVLDDYGLDMFEFFGVLKLIQNLSKNNLLGKNDEIIEDFDYKSLKDWMRKITYREGVGDILADGYNRIIDHFGPKSKEFSPATNKGLITYISPKGPLAWGYMGTMELGQVLGIRGPHAAPGGSPTYFALRPLEKFPRLLDKIGIPQDKIEEILPNMDGLNLGKLLKFTYDNFMVMAGLGLCARAQINRFYNSDLYNELFSSATGIELSKQDILKAGERIYNLLKLINIREGFSKRDEIPEQWFTEPLFKEYTGKGEITKEVLNEMVNEYYSERGWDINGVPLIEKLTELDLMF